MSAVIWFTGLPGSGKTTIAKELARRLEARGHKAQLLDGDEFREKIPGIGFSKMDRDRNVLYAGLCASYLAKNSIFSICAFVSPYSNSRETVRTFHRPFFEIWLNTPRAICEERDPKGHYSLARSGHLPIFTGVSDPYETPLNPDLILDTSVISIHDAATKIENLILKGLIEFERPSPQP